MRVLWSPLNKPLTLQCPLETPSDGNYSIEWRKDGKLIFSAYGTSKGHVAPELQGRLARAASLGITVHSLSPSDEGVYQCTVTRFAKGPTSPEFGPQMRVVVNSPPRIKHPPPDLIQYHLPSTSLSVDCITEGSPPPDVSWIKDDVIISTNSTLYIAKLREDDKGEYTCQAVSSSGQTSASISIRFARPTTIDFAPQNKTVNEGSNVYWNCHATAFPDKINYSWKLENKPIKTTDVGLRASILEAELSLSPVRPSDSGWYSCDADNGVGKAATARAYLHVNYRPSPLPSLRRLYTAPLGSHLSLSCQSDASPPVEKVLWSKNGVHLTYTNETSLLIARTSESDAGIYGCVSMNSVGRSDPFEMHVVVAEPPRFSSRPPPVIYAREGAELEVECDGFGDPMPIQYWLRHKRRFSSSRLSILSVSHSDHGLYTCVIANSVATVQAEMRLYVQNSRPQSATISSVQCLGEDGISIDWAPGYDGALPQTFTLFYENLDGEEKGRLETHEGHAELAGLSPFARYRLTVQSRNSRGETNSSSEEKNICSRLRPPEDVSLDDEELSWNEPEGAVSYRIEFRDTNTQNAFTEMAEVVSPPYHIPRPSGSLDDFELRVRSLRPQYGQSAPSSSVFYRRAQESSEPTLAWVLCGGVLCLALLIILYFFARGACCERRKKKSRRNKTQPSVYDRKPAPGDSYIESASKLLDRRDSGNWSGSRNDPLNGTAGFEPYSYEELEVDRSTSVVEDMFRQKYVFGTSPSDPTTRAHILDDLRIERLRREFKQSQL